jgi:hypothetical protein
MAEENAAINLLWEDRQEKRINVTQVTKFALQKFLAGEDSPVRSFYDGFHAVSGADQRHIRATVGKQPYGHYARNAVDGIFQR